MDGTFAQFNIDPVCFGTKNDDHGTFHIQEAGQIYTFKLVHTSGSVTCLTSKTSTKWGCSLPIYGSHNLMTVITYSNKTVLPLAEFLKGNDRTYYTYQLDGADFCGIESIMFKLLPTPLVVSVRQQFQLWYAHDLVNYTEDNNDDDCRVIEFKAGTKNKILTKHVIRSEQAKDKDICELKCYFEPNCVSYNYGPLGDGTFTCELSNRTHLQVSPSYFEYRNDFLYRAIINSCESNPCVSHSTCQAGFGSHDYRCICSDGYEGELCQIGEKGNSSSRQVFISQVHTRRVLNPHLFNQYSLNICIKGYLRHRVRGKLDLFCIKTRKKENIRIRKGDTKGKLPSCCQLWIFDARARTEMKRIKILMSVHQANTIVPLTATVLMSWVHISAFANLDLLAMVKFAKISMSVTMEAMTVTLRPIVQTPLDHSTAAVNNWEKVNIDPVCFGTKNDDHGTFDIREAGQVYTFKLVHTTGSVTCDTNRSPTKWGCLRPEYGNYNLMTVITYSNKTVLPLAEFVKSNTENKLYTYQLDGADVNSPTLVFNFLPMPLVVSVGHQFQIWYAHDLVGSTEYNNDGETCADVYALYPLN
ncbi:unnamed protein product [Pocillopora meandrina]|uniref:EGF-like domain-containing protein n=1 Tax=Pocillopora meandrina TaxID=46732 RepID=A0AAU9X3Y5_9CNID|nr:unnamed protein product [Pocillopora meandrina]